MIEQEGDTMDTMNPSPDAVRIAGCALGLYSSWADVVALAKAVDAYAAEEATDLAKALRHLRNEVRGCLAMAEDELRELVGIANVFCLIQRLKEAESVLERYHCGPND